LPTNPRLPANPGPLDWAGPDSYFYGISGLIHTVQMPPEASGADPVPAVVMVHGWGGDESVMWIFKQTLPPGLAIITPRAPLALDEAESGFIWYRRDEAGQPDPETKAAGLAKFEHFITSLPDLYPIDPSRLLLIGFSQGGAMCNALALTRPELIIGVASLGGFIPEGLTPVDSLHQLPVFIAHGSRDETVPLRAAHKARQTYTALEADLTYGEYEVGHKMNSQGMRDLKAWVRKVIGD